LPAAISKFDRNFQLSTLVAVEYDSSMKSETVPLAMPEDLLKQVQRIAKQTGLSMADAMCQSMRLGLPRLAERLSMQQVLNDLKPLTKEECEQCWGKPDPEWDALEAAMTRRGYSPSREDFD